MRIVLLIIFLFPFLAKSQSNTAEQQALELIERHKKINAAKMTMPGYRIQLYFGGERIKAQEVRSEFLLSYPEVPAYLIYQQPNFKVRAGDFRTRLEAAGFLKKLEFRFKSSFIVPDDVKLPSL